jgi:hypothetical protein
MNGTLIFFILAMILTLSHLWQRSIYFLGILFLLWLGFVISFYVPIKNSPATNNTDMFFMGFEILATYAFVLAYLIMKYVENTPIWRPLTYLQFKKAAEKQNLSKSIIYFVNTLLGLFFFGIIVFGFSQSLN